MLEKKMPYYINKTSFLCFSQSGCCKPPSDCNFTFRNATFWIPPAKNETAFATNNGDCVAWSNVQTELCFNCNACKAGVLANIREKWRHLLVFNICLLILLITVYSCGCCARRNNRTARKNDSAWSLYFHLCLLFCVFVILTILWFLRTM